MADKKISLLNSANALSGSEVLPIVQSGITKKVSILDLTDNKKVFQYVSQNLNSNPANISTRINALPNFTISQDQILGFKDFVYSGANLQRIDVYELKNIGKGNYGVGGTPLTETNFEFITSQAINFNTVSTNPSNQVITIATLSGATISAFINAKTPPYVLQSSGDGLRIFDVTDGNVFIFNGVAGTYGSANLQTVIGDFTVVPRENNVVLSVNGQTGAVVIPETVTEWEDVSGEIQNKDGKAVVVKNTSEDDQDYIFFVKKSNGSISVQVAANGTLETINNIKAARFDTDGGLGSVNGQVQLLIEAANAGFKSNKRINYETDLSATFTARSLVDKGYADTKVPLSGTTSANPITGNLFVNGDAIIDSINIGRGVSHIQSNTVVGENAFSTLSNSNNGTFIGYRAGRLNATAGNNSTFIGAYSGENNIIGQGNVAIGAYSLQANVNGFNNVAIGFGSLASNISESNNVAIGTYTLNKNTTGRGNFAIGDSALRNNTTAWSNIAFGRSAMYFNTTGSDNLAFGLQALEKNTIGSRNIAIGSFSLNFSQQNDNQGIGHQTLYSLISGLYNIAIGTSAGRFIENGGELTSADSSIFLGREAKANGIGQTNQIVIGNSAIGLGSNTTVIGNSSSVNAKIFGNVKATGSVQVSDNTAAASASNVGSIRYRATSTNSFMEMSMQTGASVFAWVIIKQNTF
jgi:hypothetical protein